MTRRFINQFAEGETVKQIFLVADKQVRANRSGNLYLQLRLVDRTGSLTGMLWNANEKISGKFESGNYLTVEGTTQFYNGSMQLIITSIENVDANFVREEDFVQLTSGAVENLKSELMDLLGEIQDEQIAELAKLFMADQELINSFCNAPAGIKNHHAYNGGLLAHVVSMLRLAKVISQNYEAICPSLLLMGTFLHDIGKVRELAYDRELSYTDEGQLVGHIQIGIEILSQKITELRQAGIEFSTEKELLLKHMILSHHGEPEFGAVKVPMTLEAIALHFIDNIDSKIASAHDVMLQDVNQGNWTTFQPNVGRKYFKGANARLDISESQSSAESH
ncbi:MAG: HD domain-containing protein [Planctomycetota bacterium]|nr:HD domain-containing protein [Planctomycetota bacterium]